MPLSPDAAKWATLASLMRELMAHPGWEAFREQMEQQEAVAIERLIADPQQWGKGFIEGMRAAYNLPQRIIDQTTRLLEDQLPVSP